MEVHVRDQRRENQSRPRSDGVRVLLDDADLLAGVRVPQRRTWPMMEPAVRDHPPSVEGSVRHTTHRGTRPNFRSDRSSMHGHTWHVRLIGVHSGICCLLQQLRLLRLGRPDQHRPARIQRLGLRRVDPRPVRLHAGYHSGHASTPFVGATPRSRRMSPPRISPALFNKPFRRSDVIGPNGSEIDRRRSRSVLGYFFTPRRDANVVSRSYRRPSETGPAAEVNHRQVVYS